MFSLGQVQGGEQEGGEQLSVPPASGNHGDAARQRGDWAAESGDSVEEILFLNSSFAKDRLFLFYRFYIYIYIYEYCK